MLERTRALVPWIFASVTAASTIPAHAAPTEPSPVTSRPALEPAPFPLATSPAPAAGSAPAPPPAPAPTPETAPAPTPTSEAAPAQPPASAPGETPTTTVPATSLEAEAPDAGPRVPTVETVTGPFGRTVVVTIEDRGAPKKSNEDEEDVEIVEETVEVRSPARRSWAGLRFGTVLSPDGARGTIDPRGPISSNRFRACLDPGRRLACGYVKGFDVALTMFEAGGSWDYPRWVGYFRTGYTAGRVHFAPAGDAPAPGQPTSLTYAAAPLFFGGNVYLLKSFPVRPYGGLGFGLDVVRLDYRRHHAGPRIDTSARVGFELHAGLEARISNYVSVHAELMQLWSARRKLKTLPDFSNTGLGVLVGVTVAVPTRSDVERHETRIRKIERVRRTE